MDTKYSIKARVGVKPKGVKDRKMERPANLGMITRVAELYCKDSKSQREIADETGVSQASVSSYVKKAERLGMIKRVFSPLPELSLRDALLKNFNLRDAIVIDIGETENYDFIFRQLGIQGALYLDTILKDGMILATCGGAMLQTLAQELPNKARKIDILPTEKDLFLDPQSYVTSEGICRLIAEKCAYQATVWDFPFFYVKYFQCALEEHVPNFSSSMDKIKNVDIYISVVGSIIPKKVSFMGRMLERVREIGEEISIDELYAKLKTLGAKGELSDTPFDANGNRMEDEWLKRVLRHAVPVVELELLQVLSARHNKHVIVLGGGRDKVEALSAALRGGLLNVLITDTVVAQGLLSKVA